MTLHNSISTIAIRQMTVDDIQQVRAIDQASFTLPWPESAYRHEVDETQSSICLVAEYHRGQTDPVIVGMIVVWLVIDESHIATIATHPDYRQQGIARYLLAVALKEIIKRGMVSVTLEVREQNLAAQSLYHQFGFVTVGRRLRYYRDNREDAILMTIHELDSAYEQWLSNIFKEIASSYQFAWQPS